MPDGSYFVLDIPDYIKYIIKKYNILTISLVIHGYINWINYRFLFEIKDGCKLELRRPETMILLGIIKKTKIEKTKNVENVPSLEVVEVVLVKFNLVDNQFQLKYEVL